jgi:hypothetical protein
VNQFEMDTNFEDRKLNDQDNWQPGKEKIDFKQDM